MSEDGSMDDMLQLFRLVEVTRVPKGLDPKKKANILAALHLIDYRKDILIVMLVACKICGRYCFGCMSLQM